MADTLRDAWFAGWKAAKLHSMEEQAAFAGAHLEGDKLVWRNVPQPPNPFPLEQPQGNDEVEESNEDE